MCYGAKKRTIYTSAPVIGLRAPGNWLYFGTLATSATQPQGLPGAGRVRTWLHRLKRRQAA
jgi:hypothetical protein